MVEWYTSKEGNGPRRLISTPKSEFLKKIAELKFFMRSLFLYAQFLTIILLSQLNLQI